MVNVRTWPNNIIVRFITIVMVFNLLRLTFYVHRKFKMYLFACYKSSKLKMLQNSYSARHTYNKCPRVTPGTPT